MVQLQQTPSQIFPLNILEILRTCSGWWLPNLSQKTKNIFEVSNIVKKIATIDVNLISLLSRYTAWLEDLEAVAPMASKEKLSLKTSQKLQENIYDGVCIKSTLQAASLQILQIETLVQVFPVNIKKFLSRLFL